MQQFPAAPVLDTQHLGVEDVTSLRSEKETGNPFDASRFGGLNVEDPKTYRANFKLWYIAEVFLYESLRTNIHRHNRHLTSDSDTAGDNIHQEFS